MLKHTTLLIFLGISFLGAENIQDLKEVPYEKIAQTTHELQELENQREALELKLEAYKLQKKIIEVEKFIEQEKLKKEERAERKAALIRLKQDLRRNRYNRTLLTTYTR